MDRTLKPFIQRDLKEKIVILSGPRQSGKTTLSRIISTDAAYFNHDAAEDRLVLQKKAWRRDCDLLILDELHKMRNWKSWIKGIYDTQGLNPPILVTGSARLDTARKLGDSLAGRFFPYRLHPFDPKEVASEINPRETVERILRVGGFPEPFLKGTDLFYRRWRRSHLDIILRQDLIDLESVRDIASIETLIEMMRHRVGSPTSYRSLAEDLQRDPKTIKHWLKLLENLFVLFPLTPYHKNIARSLLKEPKYYFYDTGQVAGDEGPRLENLVACALRKELDFIEDTLGYGTQLHYLRDKNGREIDFLPVVDRKPVCMVEVKRVDPAPSPHFAHFQKYLPGIPSIQLVLELRRELGSESGAQIKDAARWLARLDLRPGPS